MYPENFRYTKEHEWVNAEGEIGTIGITDHAQAELGDIVYVDYKLGRDPLKVGDQLKQGDSFGSVESVKAVSDIYSPVSGEVTDINHALAETPEKLNQEPHGGAWLIKVKLADRAELQNLLAASDYQTYIG